MNTPVLLLDGVARHYRTGSGQLTVLDGISFSVAAGERLAVVGPSGSGKSTLLGLMAGLDAPDAGRVVVEGRDLAGLSPSALARLRGERMGFVFQSYRLLPTLTALENIAVPLDLAGRRDAHATAQAWLERVGLGARADHLPAKLSGGEQQRVALARALAPGPALVFADEPTGNLDSRTGAAMTDLLFGLVAESAATLVLVTHDLALAARAGRRIELSDGRIVADTIVADHIVADHIAAADPTAC
ncbi:MAG: ABC transporter ATP-binding protein [Planctomycetes bacterium]|jgi:putative ABC transport system ATP-binding protein|nr:ABC transporter ATP-binding protein [Planctomycetota bacterium]